jgi:hypothetical protein
LISQSKIIKELFTIALILMKLPHSMAQRQRLAAVLVFYDVLPGAAAD